jgi:hypothetical protein
MWVIKVIGVGRNYHNVNPDYSSSAVWTSAQSVYRSPFTARFALPVLSLSKDALSALPNAGSPELGPLSPDSLLL